MEKMSTKLTDKKEKVVYENDYLLSDHSSKTTKEVSQVKFGHFEVRPPNERPIDVYGWYTIKIGVISIRVKKWLWKEKELYTYPISKSLSEYTLITKDKLKLIK